MNFLSPAPFSRNTTAYRRALFLVGLLALAPLPGLRAQYDPLPRAMWVWEANTITDTAKRSELIAFCASKGITTLFINPGNAFVDPSDPAYAGRHPVTNAQLGSFNIAAQSTGIAVWALDGDPSHCLDSNHEKVLGRLDKARAFNHNQAPNARLAGFQWDIEPHGLPTWAGASDATRRNYLAGMIKITDKVNKASRAAVAGRRNLPVGFVITFWYDNPQYILTFKGNMREASSHMFDVLKTHPGNHIAIMAYRDTAEASFPLAYDEFEYARNSASNVKVWYGQETGAVTPTHITFHEEGPIGLENAITLLQTVYLPLYRLASADVAAGVAIHSYNSYRLW